MTKSLSVLSSKENPLLQPNILSQHEDEVFEVVKAAVARCYADTNNKVPDEERNNYLLNQLTDNIINNFPSLRLKEIPVAFFNGIRGAYGEYFGLSVITFEGFLTAYLASEQRRTLVEERNRLMIEEKTEPTVEDKFKMGKQLCIDEFTIAKSGKPLSLSALAVFEFLNRLSMIDKDYKVGIMKQALNVLIKEKEHEITFCLDLHKRRRLNAALTVFNENLEKDILTKDQYAEVLRCAKRIALTNYFNDLIINDENLEALIDAKWDKYVEVANVGQ